MEVVSIFIIVGCMLMVALPILFVVALTLAITRKSTGWTVVAVLAGLLGLAALVTSLVYAGKKGAAEFAEMNEPRPFVSEDGLVEIMAPGSWSVRNLENEVASLQIGNLIGSQFLIVISEEKSEFVDEFSIRDYAGTINEQMKEVLVDAIETELLSLEVGGLTALQNELEGNIDGTGIAYLNTFIEGKDHFHQVLTWTLRETKLTHFPLFRKTVMTFQETNKSVE
ncbi:MAG: hypothetical protein P1U68_01345 [Verrucomicrobiales bacterium]|nr:hypothetical protein [Verrucomicrobiales bacterium]